MDDLDLKQICECDSEHQARIIESELAEDGIKAYITGLEASALGEAIDGPDAIRIFVQAKQLDAAQALLAELNADDPEPVPAWTCQCGEEVDEGFYVCWSCQASFDDQPRD